jgi:hypothetical protein
LNSGRYTFLRAAFLVLAVLTIADVAAGVLFGLLLPVGYFSGKSITRIVSDIAFVEGAFIFFAGALLAFFHSPISWHAKVLMVVGAAMVGLSVVFGVFS